MLSRRILLATPAALLFLWAIGYAWFTRDAMNDIGKIHLRGTSIGESHLVDTHPWQQARQLSALATTAEEEEYGHEAQRIAGHDVDQAFEAAIRQVALQPHLGNARAAELFQRIDQLTSTLRLDKAHADALGRDSGANNSKSSNVDDADSSETTELDLANAQVQLDQAELNETKADLARVSNDPSPQIQQEWSAYQAALQKTNTPTNTNAPPTGLSEQRYGTLAGRIVAWRNQNARYQLIQTAEKDAEAAVKAINATHDKLEGNSGKAGAHDADSTRTTQLHNLQTRKAERELLALYGSRIENQAHLATVYQKWADQVQLQHRIVTHLIAQSIAIIAFILLCVLALDELIRRLIAAPNLDRRRRQTFQTVLKLGVQLAGAAAILFAIFGAPTQTPTIVGLTTAGLTLVLQDFIIAFFGWFILMGKNGVRLGDWVEINGVGGEVTDVGLFRTTLLETGNWTDQGHPTGRRASFINSFAIKGQFFNFSTAGQWMWDEITISAPATGDPYSFIEQIRTLVQKKTEPDMERAQADWKRITGQGSETMAKFNVEPSVDVRPTASGMDVVVRYITRASSRLVTKNTLYAEMYSLVRPPAMQQT